jgi:Ca2+-binding RTX toxin-like protein
LTLDGQNLANQTWIFNVTSILALGANTKVELINAGEGASVIWNAHAGYTSIGAGAEVLGTIYAQNYISVGADVIVTGPNGTNGGLFTQSNYMTFGAGVHVGIADSPESSVTTNVVTGTAEAGSLVTIHDYSGEDLGTVTADSTGNFTYTLTAVNIMTLAAETNNSVTASIDIGGDTFTSEAFTYNDQLVGSYGDDTLVGSVGIDTIEGGIGADILKGGDGNDYLIGGDGADTFIWQDGDAGIDIIKDFSFAEGDKLDLSDILQVTTGNVLDDYLNFSSANSDTTIDVFVGGDASAAGTPNQTIILEGVDLGSDDVVIINNLFNGDNAGTLIISDVPAIDSSTMVLNEIPETS